MVTLHTQNKFWLQNSLTIAIILNSSPHNNYKNKVTDGIRKFEISAINFEEDNYINLFDWEIGGGNSITIHLSDAILVKIIEGWIDSINNIPTTLNCLPSLTQAVEIDVKYVIAAASKFCGYKNEMN